MAGTADIIGRMTSLGWKVEDNGDHIAVSKEGRFASFPMKRNDAVSKQSAISRAAQWIGIKVDELKPNSGA